VTSIGSAIFAFLACGAFQTVEEAQDALCPPFREIAPDPAAARAYDELYSIYRELYFGFGAAGSEAVRVGHVLPRLRAIAAAAREKYETKSST
jgi:L-ribulokinase